MKPGRSPYSVGALVRGLEVLELFTYEHPALSLTQIAASLKSSKSTVFRALSTLETMGYLEHDPATRRYRPALKVLQLGFRAINNLEVRQVARPYLEHLAQEVDETVSLAMLDGADMVYIDRVRNRSIVGVVLDIGSHLPAYCTALGKTLLAQLPPDDLREYMKQVDLKSFTSSTVVDRDALGAELSKIRKQGYAICDGELAAGLRAVGAPIRNNSGRTVAAVNVSGPDATISLGRLEFDIVPAVMRTASQISLALGYPYGEDRKGQA
jgi:PcaR/PcaU/PobR family beta-ketoadipate pathway transcriptional regulator